MFGSIVRFQRGELSKFTTNFYKWNHRSSVTEVGLRVPVCPGSSELWGSIENRVFPNLPRTPFSYSGLGSGTRHFSATADSYGEWIVQAHTLLNFLQEVEDINVVTLSLLGLLDD